MISGAVPGVVVVMGVSGVGKTTIGERVAAALGHAFQDADALHPQANIAKMAAGEPLTDADRAPWLARLGAWVRARLAAGEPGVLAASLLKRAYRDAVLGGDRRIALVYLHADPALIADRMAARRGHFMAPAMLSGQLATLEPPGAAEGAIIVEAAGPADQVVAAVLARLRGT